MQAVHASTGWLVQAHNRYWSSDTPYATQNGGKYHFLFDESTKSAVPTEQLFWDSLFGTAVAESWGLRVYEQDWLWNLMGDPARRVTALGKDVGLARQWLLQMGRAAEKNNLTIQYCMPHMRHVLQSLEVSAVTQVRASGDYLLNEHQWRIGGQSIVLNALGLLPSKDGFWSTKYQEGHVYGPEGWEPAARRQAAVASLSAGPVAVGDGIGYSDASLIIRACMKVRQYIYVMFY